MIFALFLWKFMFENKENTRNTLKPKILQKIHTNCAWDLKICRNSCVLFPEPVEGRI